VINYTNIKNMKVNKVTNNIKIDLDSFYNSETGESLVSEIIGNKTSVTFKKETDLITLKKPENFSMINLDTLNKLYQILSNSDLGYLLKMFPLTKTEMNLIYNNTIPHSNYTLQKYLDIKSNKTFHTLIKKLISVGVLYQIKGNIQGAVRVVYILNPNVSNRRKTFHNSLIDLFKDFSY
jgi:hypothetical protein